MKVAVDESHPWFHPDWWKAEVYLNGERLYQAVAANSDTGQVYVYKTDKAGGLVVKDGEYVVELRHGNVCILIPEEE